MIESDSANHHRLIEISENLHRAELTDLQRSKLVKEWVESIKGVSRQVAAKPKCGRPEGGRNSAARQLGIDEKDVRRCEKIASLSPEAQEAAIDAGLDDNQSALLDAAKHSEPEEQVKSLKSRATALA